MRFSNYLVVSVLALVSLAGCSPDNDVTVAPSSDNTNVFVLNEGGLSATGTGTVTLFSKSTSAITPDLFQRVNGTGRRLGSVVQSMAVRDKRGYIVVKGANKVEVVSLPDFKSVGVVKGLSSPRYFLAISTSRAYVTQWGRDTLHRHGAIIAKVRAGIKIVDLITNVVVDSIATGDLPERLTLAGGKVFVANSGSNTVTVIDPTTNRVTNTLTVGDAPNSFALDKNSRLRVLCGGLVAYNANHSVDYAATTPGSLYSLDPASPTSGGTSRTFASNLRVPTDIHANPAGDQLYFRAADAATGLGDVVRLGIADAALPSLTAPFISGLFYGLGIDPDNGNIYIGTGTFSADKMGRYQPNGTKIDETVVGVGPNGFVFF